MHPRLQDYHLENRGLDKESDYIEPIRDGSVADYLEWRLYRVKSMKKGHEGTTLGYVCILIILCDCIHMQESDVGICFITIYFLTPTPRSSTIVPLLFQSPMQNTL